MLIVETIARIRREHFIKGKTIKEIARDLKVSRNTVRKVLRSGETSFDYERQVQPRPKLGRWAVELDELLAANAAKSAREQLTLIRIFEELCGRGYDGGRSDDRALFRRPGGRSFFRHPESLGSSTPGGGGVAVVGRGATFVSSDVRGHSGVLPVLHADPGIE